MNRLPPAVRLLGIGWYFALCVVAGVVGGLLLDNWLGTRPVFVLLGTFFGLFLAFWGGYQMLLEVLNPDKSRDEDRR